MEAAKGLASGEQRAVVLLLYGDPERAVSLFGVLTPDRYALVSCHTSALNGRWADELEPDLVLLIPPPEPAELLPACASLRERLARPIVVLSEQRSESIVAQALSAGIDEYLTLPIGERELAARINAFLRRIGSAGAPREVSRVGGLALSNADLSAEYHGRKVSLSPTEYRLLSCLASMPGRVLTHRTLMARVWGAEYVDARHYLHLYVRYLREKLEDDPTNPRLILSEWGVGYRLQPDS